MKILLDECVTKHLKPYLPDHEVSMVAKHGWSGIRHKGCKYFVVAKTRTEW